MHFLAMTAGAHVLSAEVGKLIMRFAHQASMQRSTCAAVEWEEAWQGNSEPGSSAPRIPNLVTLTTILLSANTVSKKQYSTSS